MRRQLRQNCIQNVHCCFDLKKQKIKKNTKNTQENVHVHIETGIRHSVLVTQDTVVFQMLGVLLLISAKMSRTYSLEGELPRVRKNSCGWWGWEMGAKDRKEELSESKCQEPGEWMVSPGPSLG